MIDLRIALTILFVHWIADFVTQSDAMAKGKSTSNRWLLIHVVSYSTVMFLTWPLIATVALIDIYAWIIINGVLHFIVDYFTSRWNSKLWKKGDVHNFFVVVGFDQFIHAATLLLTYKTIVN